MSNLNYYLRMNAFFKFIGAHDEKISKVELSVIACIAICACFLFIFSLSLEDKKSSIALFFMIILGLLSLRFFLVFLANYIAFGKKIKEAEKQLEKKFGKNKDDFLNKTNAEFAVINRNLQIDAVKFGLLFLPVGFLGWQVDWWPIFHNVKEWLASLVNIFIGMFTAL